MAEQALYRKYRSADFTQVLGQDHVVKTLTTAISAGRLSHAYLFTGPKGVGKTSVARLLARALNCTSTGQKPCNQCPNCLAAINSSLDVIEMDAASNRSIDSIRDLRDKVNIAPTTGEYKVYIIDEVHMLTPEAFNALLKTLEEPPAHAVFILATTEAHKLPETIISRTQSFNFKPISEAHIIGQLEHIAAAEQIAIEPEALMIIATAARGGLRDAIGMLDQVASSGESPITATTVRNLLGYSDAEAIGGMVNAIAHSDTKAALVTLATLIDQGAQPGQIATQLVDMWRELLLAAVGTQRAANEDLAKLADELGPAHIAAIIEPLLDVTRSHWPQLALEAVLVRLTVAEAAAISGPVLTDSATPAPRLDSSSNVDRSSSQPAPDTSPTSSSPSRSRGEVLRVAPSAGTPTPTVSNEDDEALPVSGPDVSASKGGFSDADLWPKALMLVKQKNNSLCALLQMYPVDFGAEAFVIKSRFNFHRDLFNKPLNRQAIEASVERVYGRSIAVSAITDETGAKAPRVKVDPNADLVSSALEILGGEVIE